MLTAANLSICCEDGSLKSLGIYDWLGGAGTFYKLWEIWRKNLSSRSSRLGRESAGGVCQRLSACLGFLEASFVQKFICNWCHVNCALVVTSSKRFCIGAFVGTVWAWCKLGIGAEMLYRDLYRPQLVFLQVVCRCVVSCIEAFVSVIQKVLWRSLCVA